MSIFDKIITKIRQYNTPKLEGVKEEQEEIPISENIYNLDKTDVYEIKLKDVFKLLHHKADIIITTGKKGEGLYAIMYMSSDRDNELGTYIPIAKIEENRGIEKNEIIEDLKSNIMSYLFVSEKNPQAELKKEFYNYFSPIRCKEIGFKLTPEIVELFTECGNNETVHIKKTTEGIQVPYNLLVKTENKLKEKDNLNWKEKYKYSASDIEELSKEELTEILFDKNQSNDISEMSKDDIALIASRKIELMRKVSHSDLDTAIEQNQNILYKKILERHLEQKGKQAESQINELRQIIEKFDIPNMSNEAKIELFKETLIEINSRDRESIRTELDNYNDYIKKIKKIKNKSDKAELETLEIEKQTFLKKCLRQYINEYILRQDYLIQEYNQIAKEKGTEEYILPEL